MLDNIIRESYTLFGGEGASLCIRPGSRQMCRSRWLGVTTEATSPPCSVTPLSWYGGLEGSEDQFFPFRSLVHQRDKVVLRCYTRLLKFWFSFACFQHSKHGDNICSENCGSRVLLKPRADMGCWTDVTKVVFCGSLPERCQNMERPL